MRGGGVHMFWGRLFILYDWAGGGLMGMMGNKYIARSCGGGFVYDSSYCGGAMCWNVLCPFAECVCE